LSENLYTDILSFNVEDIIPRLSDHSVISLRIVASFRPVTSDIQIKDFPRQFVWNPESDIKFRKVMESPLINEQLKALPATLIGTIVHQPT